MGEPLRETVDRVARWADQARAIRAHRAQVEAAAERVFAALTSRAAKVTLSGEGSWTVLPLVADDAESLAALDLRQRLPDPGPGGNALLSELTGATTAALADVRSSFGLRRIFRTRRSREKAEQAAAYLTALAASLDGSDVTSTLSRLDSRRLAPRPVALASAVDPATGLPQRLGSQAPGQLLSRDAVAAFVLLPRAWSTIQSALAEQEPARRAAQDAAAAIRSEQADAVVVGMEIERLRDATGERLPWKSLRAAGFTTVGDIIARAAQLVTVPGIGEISARRIKGAAQTLRHEAFESATTRLRADRATATARELVRALAAWELIRPAEIAAQELTRARALAPLAQALALVPDPAQVAVFGGDPGPLLAASEAVARLAGRMAGAGAKEPPRGSLRAPQMHGEWADFLARPAEYFALLDELGLLGAPNTGAEGGLPERIVAAVRGQPLRTDYLTASLRGYQHFGARFALAQRKAIIGDEMGLGKTVEALAVIAHVAAEDAEPGAQHALVICPAAVVTNWVRETAAKTTLPAHRLHGSGREKALGAWLARGGVAVTTFESLGWFERALEGAAGAGRRAGVVVVDEAHYIKNPDAKRSQRSARLIARAGRALLLTGTPLENRLEEFRNLVAYVRPELAAEARAETPLEFRRQVAPVYLRRRQEDVLSELPEQVDVDEWVEMSLADERAYRAAVRSGNFAAMRQAALLSGPDSAKLQRLIEIVAEAEDNGRRVVVFSYYLRVLEEVARALPGYVVGPLTGAVPAARRQEMIDAFSVADAGAALVAQIVAGGVGVNIQAASVVVICEPQLKPTTEWQAIARARRMGQLHSVQVHRLLAEDSVDARVSEILARKSALFEEFAATSETAQAAPEAFDVSDAALVREVVAAERARLLGDEAGAVGDEVLPVTGDPVDR